MVLRYCFERDSIGVVPMPDGTEVLFDADRIQEVNTHNWHYATNGYAQTNIDGKKISLHRFLYPEFKQIDHINMNKLDNRSCNLREATNSQNQTNKPVYSNNTSGFKGVSWNSRLGKWQVHIALNGKRTYLGMFTCLKQAALTYNNKAIELHGAFARLNEVK